MTSELGRPAGSQKPFSPFIFNAIGGGPKPGSSVVKAKSTDNWLNEEWAAESPFQKSASLSPQEDIQLLSRSTGDFPRDSADVRAKSAPSVCPSDFLLPHLLPASRFSEDTLVDLISEYLSVVTHPAIKLPFDKLERPQPLHHARPAYRAKKAASNCLNVKLDDYKRSTFGPDARKSDTIRSPVAALRGSQVLITGTAENGKREAAFFAPDAGKPTPRIQRGRPRPTDFSPSSITGSPDTTAESKNQDDPSPQGSCPSAGIGEEVLGCLSSPFHGKTLPVPASTDSASPRASGADESGVNQDDEQRSIKKAEISGSPILLTDFAKAESAFRDVLTGKGVSETSTDRPEQAKMQYRSPCRRETGPNNEEIVKDDEKSGLRPDVLDVPTPAESEGCERRDQTDSVGTEMLGTARGVQLQPIMEDLSPITRPAQEQRYQPDNAEVESPGTSSDLRLQASVDNPSPMDINGVFMRPAQQETPRADSAPAAREPEPAEMPLPQSAHAEQDPLSEFELRTQNVSGEDHREDAAAGNPDESKVRAAEELTAESAAAETGPDFRAPDISRENRGRFFAADEAGIGDFPSRAAEDYGELKNEVQNSEKQREISAEQRPEKQETKEKENRRGSRTETDVKCRCVLL